MNHELECYTQQREHKTKRDRVRKGGEREREMCGGRVTWHDVDAINNWKRAGETDVVQNVIVACQSGRMSIVFREFLFCPIVVSVNSDLLVKILR